MAQVTKKKSEKGNLLQVDDPAEPIAMDEEIRKQIAEMAYELHEKHGRIHGHDLKDWFEAERLVLAELSPLIERPTKVRSRRRQAK